MPEDWEWGVSSVWKGGVEDTLSAGAFEVAIDLRYHSTRELEEEYTR